MAKRKGPRELGPDEWRAYALTGIERAGVVAYYDEALRTLHERGQDNYVAAMQLREACQWTETLEKLQSQLREEISAKEINGRRVAALTRAKRAAEAARTEILESLLLVPQRPRGRPAREQAPRDGADADDAWESFDDEGSEAVAP